MLEYEVLVILDLIVVKGTDGLSDDLNLELVLHSMLGDSVLELSDEAVTLISGHVFKRWHFLLF